MPTSLMKQVVRIFAVVWLVLNERVLWKSVVSKKRVRWELRMLLLRKCPAFREATAVLTPHRQHQRSKHTPYSQRTKLPYSGSSPSPPYSRYQRPDQNTRTLTTYIQRNMRLTVPG